MSTTHKAVSQTVEKRRNRSSLSLPELMQMRMQKLRINAQAVHRRSGLSVSFISRLLSGERLVVDDEAEQKLAKGIDVAWMDVVRAVRNSRVRRREQQLQQPPTNLSEA